MIGERRVQPLAAARRFPAFRGRGGAARQGRSHQGLHHRRRGASPRHQVRSAARSDRAGRGDAAAARDRALLCRAGRRRSDHHRSAARLLCSDLPAARDAAPAARAVRGATRRWSDRCGARRRWRSSPALAVRWSLRGARPRALSGSAAERHDARRCAQSRRPAADALPPGNGMPVGLHRAAAGHRHAVAHGRSRPSCCTTRSAMPSRASTPSMSSPAAHAARATTGAPARTRRSASTTGCPARSNTPATPPTLVHADRHRRRQRRLVAHLRAGRRPARPGVDRGRDRHHARQFAAAILWRDPRRAIVPSSWRPASAIRATGASSKRRTRSAPAIASTHEARDCLEHLTALDPSFAVGLHIPRDDLQPGIPARLQARARRSRRRSSGRCARCASRSTASGKLARLSRADGGAVQPPRYRGRASRPARSAWR